MWQPGPSCNNDQVMPLRPPPQRTGRLASNRSLRPSLIFGQRLAVVARVATVAARGPSSLTRRLAWLVCTVLIHGVREVAVTGCDIAACCPVVALLCGRHDGGDLCFPASQRVLVLIGARVALRTQVVPLIRERLLPIRCGVAATPSFICRSCSVMAPLRIQVIQSSVIGGAWPVERSRRADPQ
jgi:hypothetical protein